MSSEPIYFIIPSAVIIISLIVILLMYLNHRKFIKKHDYLKELE